MPELASDLTNITQSLQGMEAIQGSLSFNDFNSLQSGKNMFELLNTLKSFDKIISTANEK